MSVITSINSFAVRADKACDYIPVVSTLSNLVDLFQKCVVLPLMSSSTTSLSGYYQHLQDKSISRSILLLIPFIGNIIVAINDDIANDCNSEDYMLNLIQSRGHEAFKYASARLKKDENFLIQAFIINPDILRHIHFNSEDDREAFLTKVSNRYNQKLCDYTTQSKELQPKMADPKQRSAHALEQKRRNMPAPPPLSLPTKHALGRKGRNMPAPPPLSLPLPCDKLREWY